ncbi:MAG: ubiquinone/menaquinone biosynthesis methyltransferase [Deltaproteobacteria bacterium]|nr:ubiquinone/menaquinone biosynthesis methyltransferase [Deltaproteobacteria bacterium]
MKRGLTGPAWEKRMQEMFRSISYRYDMINTLMTFGRDRAWRRRALQAVSLLPGGEFLDVGAGTGKLSLDMKRKDPAASITALDLTREMMEVGFRSPGGGSIMWCCGNALNLPFVDDRFDGVISGYLMRNVTDVEKAFSEQLRVVKPGRCVVCLDTCPPRKNVLYPLIMFYFRAVMPRIGGLLTGNRAAYRYLPESTQTFKPPEELAVMMRGAGFHDVRHRRFMLGTIGLVWGTKPADCS